MHKFASLASSEPAPRRPLQRIAGTDAPEGRPRHSGVPDTRRAAGVTALRDEGVEADDMIVRLLPVAATFLVSRPVERRAQPGDVPVFRLPILDVTDPATA